MAGGPRLSMMAGDAMGAKSRMSLAGGAMVASRPSLGATLTGGSRRTSIGVARFEILSLLFIFPNSDFILFSFQ